MRLCSVRVPPGGALRLNVTFAILSVGGDSHLQPRAGDGDEDHRRAGGLGRLLAVAGGAPLHHHAGLRRRRHRPVVGHHRGALLPEVRGHRAVKGLLLIPARTVKAMTCSPVFIHMLGTCCSTRSLSEAEQVQVVVVVVVVRFRTASSWTVMAGKHDLENPEEESQQVRPQNTHL